MKAVEHFGSWMISPLIRLWVVTFTFNLVGGVLFAFVFVVEGALPLGSSFYTQLRSLMNDSTSD